MGSKTNLVGNFIEKRLKEITFPGNQAASKAALAKLRRGVGKSPGSSPELWQLTLNEFPEELMGSASTPSEGEWAAHIALTLFSIHQQSKDIHTQCMNQSGAALGRSLRRLVKEPEDEARIKRRFDAVLTSQSPHELANHLRGLVQLLRDAGIPLDYPLLGTDIYRFQFPTLRDGVRLQWGRDYYRQPDQIKENDITGEGKENNDEKE